MGFLSVVWKPLLIILAFVAFVGGIYLTGYNAGERNCKADWDKEKAEQIMAINKRVDEIKTTSEGIAKNQETNNKKTTDNLNAIIKKLKANSVINNTYTTVADCRPTDTYVETWNDISKKANTNK